MILIGGRPEAVEENVVDAPEGRATLIIGAAPLQIAVEADGFRRTLAKDVTGDLQVTMRRALRVKLRLRDGTPSLETGVRLEAWLRPQPDAGAQLRTITRRSWRDGILKVEVGAAGERSGLSQAFLVDLSSADRGRAALPECGTYGVTLLLARTASAVRQTVRVESGALTVTVQDIDEEQVLDLPGPSPTTLATACAALQQQR